MKKDKHNKVAWTSSIANAFFLVKQAWKLYPKGVIIKMPLIICRVVLKFLPLLFIRNFLNLIQLGSSIYQIFLYLIIYGGCFLIINLLSEMFNQLSERHDSKMRKIMKIDISRRITQMPYYKVEDPKIRTFLRMIENNMDVPDLLSLIAEIVMQIFVLCGLVSIICTLQPVIIILIIVVLIVRSIVNNIGRKLWNNWRTPINDEMRKVSYLINVLGDSSYGKEIRINGLQGWMSKKMSDAEDRYIDRMSKYNRKLQRKNVFIEVALIIQELIVYLLLAYRVFFGGLLIGDFTMYVDSISSLSVSISCIMNNTSNILKTGDFFALYRELFEKEEKKEYQPLSDVTHDFKIKFDHVSFSYPGNDRLILDDVTFEIKKGQSLSIVGMNGAGKTTLVKLICRFYKPTLGTIYLNGKDIFSFSYDEYNKILGVVFQDYSLFGFSIKENISLSSNGDTERVYSVLEKCGLAEKVKNLPNTLDTSMSKVIDDNGMEFSGGESQRIELCRVLYKDPPIVILDEPTASLDPASEYNLYKLMYECTKEKCSIFISHRLASTHFTDFIAVVSNGKIVEYGTFEDLINIPGGLFKQTYDTQAKYYT